MKRFSSTALVLAASLAILSGCRTHIDPGHVGIRITSCGDNALGVDPKPYGVGYHADGPCTTFIQYPTFVQSAVWSHDVNEGNPVNEEITFTNADKMSIAVDISLAYQLEADKAPAFYEKFRADNLKTFTDGFMRNLAREKFDESAGKFKIDDIMGDNSKFIAEVKTNLQKDLEPYGIKIQQFGFIGAPRPPQAVIDAINATTHATQVALQIQNELAQSTAEAKKKVAVAEGEATAAIAKAKGQAEAMRIASEAQANANRVIAASVTPALIEYRKLDKWNGSLPQYVGVGSSTITVK